MLLGLAFVAASGIVRTRDWVMLVLAQEGSQAIPTVGSKSRLVVSCCVPFFLVGTGRTVLEFKVVLFAWRVLPTGQTLG
jgi:hypothetical protein